MCMLCKTESIKYICDNCYRKYPIDMKMEFIPLDKYNCYIFSLFQNKLNFDYNFYIEEYSQIYNYFSNLGYHIIFNDSQKMDMDSFIELDMITKLIKNDVLVITFNVNET